jgi:hypothetical protein
MKSEHDESFREGGRRSADVTAPRDAGTVDRTPITTPATLWLGAAESALKWYGAMVRLAFGFGRMDNRGEAQELIARRPPVKPEEQSSRNSAPDSPGPMNGRDEAQSLIASPPPAPLTPAGSPPVAALHSVPTVPVKPRAKRRKTASRGKTARSSKRSSTRRNHRRAA